MKVHLLAILMIGLVSCNKSEEASVKAIDQKIFGRWLETALTFQHTQYIRSTRFGEYERGLVIFDDGTLIERSEGGICIGEYCLMENYTGTYSYDANQNHLKVSVVNYSGPQTYILDIINLTTDSLKVSRK
jgi:hypothetical protein